MGATIKGLGVQWGVQGLTFTGFGSIAALPQTLGLTRGAQKGEVADDVGDTRTQVFYDERKTLSLNVVPAGTTVAQAGTCLDNFMPAPGTTITVTDSTNATVDGSHSGKYNLLSAALRKLNNGAASIDLELETMVANDVTTVVS